MNEGHVWIVGAGPGDPGLLTVAGAAALARAEVVLYDALSSPALLRGVPAEAELVYVGKRAGQHAMKQEEMNTLLVAHARRGRRVVRLKGGDPFVFGRGSEEALACRAAGVPFTIVPGISSAIAAPAYAGIPVTHRGLAANFMVITGNDAGTENSGTDWAVAARADALVILMGVSTLAQDMELLRGAGKPAETPVACIRWGTRPDQRVLRGTIGTIAGLAAEAGLESPVVTVVGAVAALAGDLAWFEPGPLAGKSIVVTRARTQSSDLAARFEALGAYVVQAPAIRVRLLPGNITNDERVSSRWDWIVFASQNGVESFFAALRQGRRDARTLGTTQVAAIGEATTAALLANGIVPDFQPSRATSAVLAAELPRVSGARIFLPSSSLADDQLAQALRKRGGHVEQVAAYETLPEPLDDERLRQVLSADAITFTSASTARNLRAALGEAQVPASTKLVSIGEQTSDAVRECFGRLDAQADEASLDALVAATREALPWG
ncbi:MAG: uroporphyrinogen-III C-methyltransferase [Anaerolinea sp.]|nr:uroporphyrinogen-III C-methyltransferase [Anaerolinea sp.]